MKNKQILKTAQKQALNIPVVIARLMFWITFKKVPKKQFGRCVTCVANEICYKIKVTLCVKNSQNLLKRLAFYGYSRHCYRLAMQQFMVKRIEFHE